MSAAQGFKVLSPCHGREFVKHPNPIGGYDQHMFMCPHCWRPFHEFEIRVVEVWRDSMGSRLMANEVREVAYKYGSGGNITNYDKVEAFLAGAEWQRERDAEIAEYKRKAIEACEHVPGDVKARASKSMCDEIANAIRAGEMTTSVQSCDEREGRNEA